LNTLLKLVRCEQTGEVINRGLMHNIIKMLTELGPSVYHEDFEKPFVEEVLTFYSIESQQFIECCDCRLKQACPQN
jgi:cullin 3